MNRLLRALAFAATGAAALSIYRQLSQRGAGDTSRRRHPLETWENEGGAVPLPNTAAVDAADHPRRWESRSTD